MNADQEQMVSSFSAQPKLFGGCSTSKLLQNSGTCLPQLMNTSGFHRHVGEGNKSLNAMSPDPLLSEAFGKGSDCARLGQACPGSLYQCNKIGENLKLKKKPVLSSL